MSKADKLPPQQKNEAGKRKRQQKAAAMGMPIQRSLTKTDAIDTTIMVERGYPVGVIATRLGLTEYQVEKLKAKIDVLKERGALVKELLADFWYTIADEALAAITEDKLRAMSAKDLAVTAAVATDKARLLEGKPTEIVAQYEQCIKKFILVVEEQEKPRLEDVAHRIIDAELIEDTNSDLQSVGTVQGNDPLESTDRGSGSESV